MARYYYSDGSVLDHYDFNRNLHRTDGPAVERDGGHQEWWEDGAHHRLDGPAIVYCDGTKTWYKNGKLHRLGGPAIEYSWGTKEWWQNGKRHRVTGPAIDGSIDGIKKWYIDGKKLNKKQFEKTILIMKLSGLL